MTYVWTMFATGFIALGFIRSSNGDLEKAALCMMAAIAYSILTLAWAVKEQNKP